MAKLKGVSKFNFRAKIISILFNAKKKGSMKEELERVKREASEAVANDYQVIILTTKGMNEHYAPIPTLLATSAVINI